jgi:hypothetical protein
VLDIGGLLTLVLLGVWLFAVIDVLVSDKGEVRNLPKWAWLVVVVLFMALGAILWFLLGRPSRLFSGARIDPTRTFGPPRNPMPRRARPSRAERAEEEAEVQARIAERDRMLEEWAQEDQHKDSSAEGQA